MDQRSGHIGVALIGVATGAAWWWAIAACRAVFTRPGALPSLILAMAATAYLCVPETDQFKGVAVLLVGVTLVELVSGEVLPAPWHAVVLASVLWAALFGATGRTASVVGAVFSGWVAMLPALLRHLIVSSGPWARAAVVAVAVAAAVVVARTGALGTSVHMALVWAAATAGVSALMALLLLQPGRRRPHPR